MKTIVLSCLLFVVSVTSCNDSKAVKDPVPFGNALNSDIDTFVKGQMKTHDIPGMAVAVIGPKGWSHHGFYGKMSVGSDQAITNKTVFKIFSLTKTMVAVGIYQLYEEGRLSLDDSLSAHFDNLPELWKPITIANLLSHSSGLPDVLRFEAEFRDDSLTNDQFIKLLFNEKMDFATGTDWRYNQTNYILLRMIMEKVTGLPFQDYILKQQFPGASPEEVLFSSDPDLKIANAAKYYNYDRTVGVFKPKPEFSGDKNLPLAGLNLTLDTYFAWSQKLDSGLLLKEATKKSMWTPFEFSKTDRAFLHGWDVYKVNGHNSIGFSGGGVSGYRKFLDRGFSVIVLTTGYKNYSVQDMIIDQIAGMVDVRLKDEAALLIENISAEYLLSSDSLNVAKMVAKVKSENPSMDLEPIFNTVGYRLFFDLDRKKDAIALFESNVLAYPESYDAYGSLGYLQLLTEQYVKARKNYVRARELNPNNPYSDRRINEIDAILSDRP